MKQVIYGGAALLFSAVLLVACGGGGGGSLASGGIGGTGSGSITGIGSIFLNGSSGEFNTDTAEISIDDEPGLESELNVGMTVELEASSVDATFSSGVAQQVRVLHQVKGPITSLTPLTVLGQTIVVTGDTRIEDDQPHPANRVELVDLAMGDLLEVSGPADGLGDIRAVRLELKGSLARWQLVGRVSGLAGSTFSIGAQPVDIESTVPRDCDAGLKDGDRVVVKASPNAGFVADDTLTQVFDLECIPDRLGVGGVLVGTVIEGEFEGFVSQAPASLVVNPIEFSVAEQPVRFDLNTVVFEGGTEEDILVGVKLNVQGAFNTDTGVLTADRIRFRETRVRLEGPAIIQDGPVTALQVGSVDLLGLTVTITAQTEVEADLVPGQQVRINGFIESDGTTIIADEVKDRGAADLSDVRVRGPADNINAGAQTFTLFGITVLNTGSVYEIEEQPVTAEAFFDALALSQGREVSVEDAIFDGANNELSFAVIELEIED